ncbi:MAG: hypothetical protein HOC20_04920 [Chloroflexi bacterium]|nr:hypothetical protein [Chloroflexota bacterium]
MSRPRDPEVERKALQLRNQGTTLKTILETIQQDFGDRAPDSIKTISRWIKEQKDRIRKLQNEVVTASDENSEECFISPMIAETISDSAKSSQSDVPPPPSVDDLIDQGVPKDRAPWVLANWDMAYIARDPYRFEGVQKLMTILKTYHTMPYDKAVQLAQLELTLEYINHPGLREFIDRAKRYHPWEGGENQKAFDAIMSQIGTPVIKSSRTHDIDMITNQEDDGRWKAVVMGSPQYSAYGDTEDEALNNLTPRIDKTRFKRRG